MIFHLRFTLFFMSLIVIPCLKHFKSEFLYKIHFDRNIRVVCIWEMYRCQSSHKQIWLPITTDRYLSVQYSMSRFLWRNCLYCVWLSCLENFSRGCESVFKKATESQDFLGACYLWQLIWYGCQCLGHKWWPIWINLMIYSLFKKLNTFQFLKDSERLFLILCIVVNGTKI